MRNILFFSLFQGLLTFSLVSANDAAETLRIPTECTMREQWFTSTLTYEVMEKNQLIGTIEKSPCDFTYNFYDAKGTSQATLSMIKGIPQGYFILNDVNGNSVGDIREEIGYLHTYSFIAPNGTLIARANQNFWGTKFTIVGPETNYLYAIVSKHFMRKKWTINIEDPTCSYYQGIDPRLYTVLVTVEQDRFSWQQFVNNVNVKSIVAQEVSSKSIKLNLEKLIEASQIADEEFEAVEAITEPLLLGVTCEDAEGALEILSPLLDKEDTRLTATQKIILQLMIEARFE